MLIDAAELAEVQKIADEQKAKKIVWNHKYITTPQNMLKVYTVYDFVTHAFVQLSADANRLTGLQEVSDISYIVNPQEKVFPVRFFEQGEVFHFGFDGLTSEKLNK